MAERETEHVRMLDAGRLQSALESPLTTACFESVQSDKFQVLARGNNYGLSFMASPKGKPTPTRFPNRLYVLMGGSNSFLVLMVTNYRLCAGYQQRYGSC